jgi:hypothetical protein
LFHGAGWLKNDDIRGAQTHVYKSGGRQPAVVCETRLRWNCDFYREMNATKSGGRQPAVVGDLTG